jgi:tRNA threonylcarbamoyladenosine biosynthesis protein TsaE
VRNKKVFSCRSPAKTRELGLAIGRAAKPGLLIALTGPLGSGKTTLIRAIAEGMEVEDTGKVASPTFVIVREYHAPLTLYHVDAYRLHSWEDAQSAGLEDLVNTEDVIAVEWADHIEEMLPPDRLEIGCEHLSPRARRFTVTATGPISSECLEDLSLA